MEIKVKEISVPKYQQIGQLIIDKITSREITIGDKLPSINEIAASNNLARETVVKAFKSLQQKGVINAIHGKGFYVASTQTLNKYHVFALVSNFNAYKIPMFNNIKSTLGENAVVDFYFHHYNFKLFDSLLKENRHNYDYFILSSFEHKNIMESIEQIPFEKRYLIDRYPAFYTSKFNGVYQDFENDIYTVLMGIKEKALRYEKLIFLFKDFTTQPPEELIAGFEKFCKEISIPYEVHTSEKIYNIKKKEAYIVIDDEDLVEIVMQAVNNKFILGKDLGLISYNESSLKKVILSGISTISTDFGGMGKKVATMILEKKHEVIKNPCSYIDRNSF